MKSLFRFLILISLTIAPAMAEERSHNLYWAPDNVTVGGKDIDFLLNFIFWLTAAVFVLTQAVYIVYIVKYRRKPGVKAHYCHGNNFLEIVWTSIPTLIFLGLAIYSNRVWFDLHRTPPADALQINVSGYQFAWDLRYPGADGKLGQIDVSKISTENKFGIVPGDKNAEDDFTSAEMVVPVGRPIQIVLNSRDVIHSFYVPEFRIYQDAVPGRTITWVWFEITRPGNFQLACSQLCGTGHYNMKANIRAIPQAEYDKWYEGKVKAAADAAAAAPATAQAPTTTDSGQLALNSGN